MPGARLGFSVIPHNPQVWQRPAPTVELAVRMRQQTASDDQSVNVGPRHAGFMPNVGIRCALQVQLDRCASPHKYRALVRRKRVGIDPRPSDGVDIVHAAKQLAGRTRPNARRLRHTDLQRLHS